MAPTLYRRARLDAPGPLGAPVAPAPLGAFLTDDGRVAWVGPDATAAAQITGVETVDLAGRLVLPAFTDAHVHVTETGLLLDGVDLAGCRSVTGILDLVAAAAQARPGRQILGHGWDELRLAEGRPPTRAELDRAGGGAHVYLSRVDVHSAIVSSALAGRAGCRDRTGWSDDGRVERDAHHVARHTTRFALPPADRAALQTLALRAAAAAGIGEVHEMSAPEIAPEQDLAALLSLTSPGPAVVPYYGRLARDEGEALKLVAELAGIGITGLAGLAGDLMVDGSIGSHTACLAHAYSDLPAGTPAATGHLYLAADEIRDHVVACTRAGLQAGFHVIGDGAVAAVLAGFEAAAATVGVEAMRAAGHRLEHLEAIDPAGIATAARLGLVASVQPAFDAEWGGPDGMYALRLGAGRAEGLNPFAALLAAGVPLAFGSDSPVTPFAPWESVRAAVRHRTPAHAIPFPAAFHAHTAAAHAAGVRGVAGGSGRGELGEGAAAGGELPSSSIGGFLAVGSEATFAVWDDPRTLAEVGRGLTEGAPAPRCLRTVVAGVTAFDRFVTGASS